MRARLARQTTASPEAYEYYLKGMGHLDRGRSGGADVQPAIVLFKKAVEVDPKFGLELPSDSSSGFLNYLKQAAALDPSPSSLEKRIAEIEARAPAPVRK